MNRKQEVDFLVHCFRRYARRPVKTRARHRLRHRPAPDPAGRARLPHVRARPLAREHRVPPRAGGGQGPRRRSDRGGHDALPAAAPGGRRHLHAGLAGAPADQRGASSPTCAAWPGRSSKGGLYVFDRYMCSSWTDPARRWSWTRRRGRATVRATFEALKDLNPVTQTFFEDMELEAHENGTPAGLPPAPRLAHGLPAGAAGPGRSWPAASSWSSGSTASSPTSASTRPTIRC